MLWTASLEPGCPGKYNYSYKVEFIQPEIRYFTNYLTIWKEVIQKLLAYLWKLKAFYSCRRDYRVTESIKFETEPTVRKKHSLYNHKCKQNQIGAEKFCSSSYTYYAFHISFTIRNIWLGKYTHTTMKMHETCH